MTDVRIERTERLVLKVATLAKRSIEDEENVSRAWRELRDSQGSLFDGPIASVVNLGRTCNTTTIYWASTTYRYYAVRASQSYHGTSAKSLYASVIVRTTEGAILFGKMAEHTASPNRWQLPGGTIAPPEQVATMKESYARQTALRELHEEVGLQLEPTDLRLWGIKSGGEFGDVGVFYITVMPFDVAHVREVFERHLFTESSAGRRSELVRLEAVTAPEELLIGAADSVVDYAGAVCRAFCNSIPQGC